MPFLFNIQPGDIGYDIETYPNVFTLTAIHTITDQIYYFEISEFRNDLSLLCCFIERCQIIGNRWVGFNNIGFDYPVVHWIYQNRNAFITVTDIYTKAMSIINAHPNVKFAHMVWESDWLVPQIDLFKIHHFDNKARSTSLKVLEFNMRSDDIEDLPFDVGSLLTPEQISILAYYNKHDVKETIKFYHKSLDQIKFREELSVKYDKNFLNHNDTKIGKDFFIMRLEEHTPGCCYRYVDNKRKMVQTIRDHINLSDVILPYVRFEQSEFNRILTWFKSQIITETKGSIKDIHCTVNDFQFDFGTGGIHGSIESQIIESDNYWIIEDWDVASYYPNLAISNGLYPEHLGQAFCTIYKEVYEERKKYKKGTAENAMLKLALNGVYGDSNNQYSPFYDPQYTMSITINGQLLLCMLAETLMKCSDLQMIQINTDGLTVRYPRHHQGWVHNVAEWWEQLTNLELENAEYKRFMVRDVNNYIAEYIDGKVKRKGAYEYDLEWHQNHSSMIIAKAAEAALVYGKDIRQYITDHQDIHDFMLRAKVPRNTILEWGGEKVPNIVRYYISIEGKMLEKVMPPVGPHGAYKRANNLTDEYYNTVLAEVGNAWDERIHTKNKSTYDERRTGINTGWGVMLCNNIQGHTFTDLNYEWYIKETEKLVKPLIAHS